MIVSSILLVCLLVIAGCELLYRTSENLDELPNNPPEISESAIVVLIKDFKFSPAILEIDVGQEVIWIQEDVAPHTVTSTEPADVLASDTLEKGEVFSFTFEEAGTFEYFCSIHPSMLGKVIVNE